MKRNNCKYIERKYIWDDNKYYIGEFRNNLPNGKGIKYYSNGNILYEGNFINGKFEGNGKYYYDNGYYFIGEYKNGLRNGKGIIYYKNGNIQYEGDWVNDKPEGNVELHKRLFSKLGNRRISNNQKILRLSSSKMDATT